MIRLVATLIVVMVLSGCGGEGTGNPASPTSPSSPTPVGAPTVRVDVTYYTNHTSTDPDHWHLRICPDVTPLAGCRGANASNPAARTPGTITWTGPLPAGRYTAMVEMWDVDRSIDIALGAASGSAPGGVERNSLRFRESNSAPVNVYAYRPCGVTTTYTKRPDLAGFSPLHYVTFEFVVSAGATATC